MNEYVSNSFQVPNALIDDAMSHLSDKALKVYLVILRKTRGWNKQSDKISVSQIQELTGYSDKRTVSKAVKELVNFGIVVAKKGKGRITEYCPIDGFCQNEVGASNVPTNDEKQVHEMQVHEMSVGTFDVPKVGTFHAESRYMKCTPTKHTIQNPIQKRERAEKKSTRFSPPSLDDVLDYFNEEQFPFDEAEKFFDYYEANGWMAGKNKMKNWKAAVRNWVRRSNEYAPASKYQSNQQSNSGMSDWLKDCQL